MSAPAAPTVYLLSLTATGVAVARDVAPHGWRVVGVGSGRFQPGRFSRLVSRDRRVSDRPLGPELVDALLAAARRQPTPPIAVPASDEAVGWCVANRARLLPHVRLSAGLVPELAGVLLDKSAFSRRCVELGIDVPLTVQPADPADVRAFLAEAGLPCIVKPREGHLWRKRLHGSKLLVARTEAELSAILEDVIGEPSAVVLQELVPGPESDLVVGAVWAAESGGVREVVTGRKIRQFPRDFGSGSLVRSESLPEVRRLSTEIVEKLGYRGLCGTEFKRDARTGRLRLIEVNPRPTLWYDLCRATGASLIWPHVQELAGFEPDPVPPQRNGVVWRYLVRDLVALAQTGPRALVEEGLQHTDADAVMAWRDPLSGVASVAHAIAQAATHLRRRRGGS